MSATDFYWQREAGINQRSRDVLGQCDETALSLLCAGTAESEKTSLDQEVQVYWAVNDFAGAYEPEGSGSIAKSLMTRNIQFRIDKSSGQESDNNKSPQYFRLLCDHQSDKHFQQTINKIAGKKWDGRKTKHLHVCGNVLEAI